MITPQQNSIHVPPGHEVFVFSPVSESHIVQTNSGAWLIDLGSVFVDTLTSLLPLFEKAKTLAERDRNSSFIWILQESYLAQLPKLKTLYSCFENMLCQMKDTHSHSVVFPLSVPERFSFMQELLELGIGVHFSGPDQACFVEVTGPSDIVAGMPGRAFLGLETPLSDLMSKFQSEGKDKFYNLFVKQFIASQVGVIVSEGRGLGNTQDSQGRSLVLVFADPDAFQINFGHAFNAEMSGQDVLHLVAQNSQCHGVLVNHAQTETSTIIERERIEDLLLHLGESENDISTPNKEKKPWWKFW